METYYKISFWSTNWINLTEIGEKCLKYLPDHEMNPKNKHREGQVCKD